MRFPSTHHTLTTPYILQAISEFHKSWRRFRRNTPAWLGLWMIVAACLIALFGYALAPDHTPDANTQLTELALRPPGFEADLLPLPLDRPTEKTNWLGFLWHGQPAAFRWIPVEGDSVEIRGDSIYFQRLGQQKYEAIHVVRRLFAIQDSVKKTGENYTFTDQNAQFQQITSAEISARIKNQSLLQTRTFPFGTDRYGRCILSRLLLGFRVSLLVGAIAVLISLTIGIFLGALGGYFGGRIDDAVMLLVNTIWSIPTLLLVFAIVLALGRGIGIIFLAVGLTMWVDVARLVRGQVLALREMQFVEAARSMGFGSGRILFRHILPNLLGPVLVVMAGNFATAILLESGLSYLGFGVQPPAPSWGTMLNENYGYAMSGKPLLALVPALAIAGTVLAFNAVGNGLRDALDVRG